MTRASAAVRRSIHRRAWSVFALLLSVAAVLATAAAVNSATVATTAAPPSVGIVCTSNTGANPTFDLTTKTGYISLPDGNTTFMWGYSNGSDPFQHPGPVLCVNQGDTVTVILHNTAAREPRRSSSPARRTCWRTGRRPNPSSTAAAP